MFIGLNSSEILYWFRNFVLVQKKIEPKVKLNYNTYKSVATKWTIDQLPFKYGTGVDQMLSKCLLIID